MNKTVASQKRHNLKTSHCLLGGVAALVFATGCCATKTVVHRPYDDVKTAMTRLQRQVIPFDKPWEAGTFDQPIKKGKGWELSIWEGDTIIGAEFVTTIQATPEGTNATSVTVSSKHRGMVCDCPSKETEKKHLDQLTRILDEK